MKYSFIPFILGIVCMISSCKESNANNSKAITYSTDALTLRTENGLDTLLLPIAEDTNIGIFLPGIYRGTEPSDYTHMLSEEWYAIYLDSLSKDFYLEKALIEIGKFDDECLGDSTTYISSKNNKSIELFVKGIVPKDLHLKTFHHTQTSVWTGSQYSFDWNNQHYTLRAEGNAGSSKQFDKDELGRTTCWEDSPTNYKLYLSNGSQEQLLVAIPLLNDTNVQIIFIGDLDEDGKPDFIFDTSSDYEEKRVVLFLSSKAKNSEIVKCVGDASYQFDC